MALNAGFSAPIVQALEGWTTERMMKRYATVTDQTPAEAVSVNEQMRPNGEPRRTGRPGF